MGTAFAEAVKVNGTCVLGNCTTPDTLNAGQTLNQPFNFIYTLANGDQFQFQGVPGEQNIGGTSWLNTGSQHLVTCLGSSAGAALSGADVLTFDFLQNFQNSGVTTATGSLTLIGDFVGPIASAGSSVYRIVSLNNSPYPTLGPVSQPPNAFSVSFSNLTNPKPVSGSPVLYDSQWTFSFDAGSVPGAGMVSVRWHSQRLRSEALFPSSVRQPPSSLGRGSRSMEPILRAQTPYGTATSPHLQAP